MKADILANWLLEIMIQISPPRVIHTIYREESEEQIKVRYAEIAKSISHAIETDGALFREDTSGKRTAALILSIMKHESGLLKSVQIGKRRGDGGRSWCLMQVNIGNGPVYFGTPEMNKWYGKDLVTDIGKCVKVGLHALRTSVNTCSKNYKGFQTITAYTAGRCLSYEKGAYNRWEYAERILRRYANSPQTSRKEK